MRPPGPAFGVCDPPGGVCLLRGDHVLDLAGLGLEPFADAAATFAAPTLGPFLAAGREAWACRSMCMRMSSLSPAAFRAGLITCSLNHRFGM